MRNYHAGQSVEFAPENCFKTNRTVQFQIVFFHETNVWKIKVMTVQHPTVYLTTVSQYAYENLQPKIPTSSQLCFDFRFCMTDPKPPNAEPPNSKP